MPDFKNFANGGMEDGSSSAFSSIRHRQIRETKAGSRIERVWAIDFERCESREDFEKYISKYSKYELNKFVSQAKAKIESLDAEEHARIDGEKARIRNQQYPVSSGTVGNINPPKNRVLQAFMKVAVWVIIIGGVGLYSYHQYKSDNNNDSTDTMVIQSEQQDYPDNQNQHIHSEYTQGPEEVVVESDSEPQEVWWDCNFCSTTGRCQLCFGSGRCAVCGGGGQTFSVFDGNDIVPGRMTDCGNCGGSGRCPSCDGSGACFACHGRGKCKLEE